MTDPANSPRPSASTPPIAWGASSTPATSSVTPNVRKEPERLTAGMVMERLETKMTALLRTEFSGIKERMDSLAVSLARIEQRLDAVDGGATGEGASAQPGSAGLALVEQRLADIDDRVSTDVIDAIVAVVQHLEAVQTATTWTLMQELRKL